MLLTSGQISMAVSSGVVFIFTSLLFLSGYVLQQQTVRSIQAAIKPPPPPVPTLPPSPVLAKHFGTPPGHSFYDKYLASNRPQGGWAKVAYVQLVREHIHVCNAVMLFAALEREGSMAQRIILYPKTWDKQSSDRRRSDSQLETSMRLLRNAASRYRVMLQPIEPMLDLGEAAEATYPLVSLFSLTSFNRVVYFPPSGLILNSEGIDMLFTLPMETPSLGISANTQDDSTTSSVLLFQPSVKAVQDVGPSLAVGNYSEEEYLQSIPLMTDFAGDKVHLVAKTSALHLESDRFDATEFLDVTSYVQLSDPLMPGPEFDAPRAMLDLARPDELQPRKAWVDVYERYREQRMDVCGLDLAPVAKAPADDTSG